MPENVHVHERISYSSDFITSFRTNVNTISKKVRKQIFAHRIWKPRNKERHTLLAVKVVKPLVQSKHLNFVCLNIRSFKNKTTSLFDFIVSQNLDVLALTETWLCNGDNIILNELLPPGYDIRHVDRGRRGGGVALIYKKDISFRHIVTTNEITQFELLDCIIKVNKLSTRVVVVYRPPPSCKNGLRYEDFAVEWASYIEQFVEVQEELLIVGDFNIHVDSSNNESQSFLDILNANGLIQHVKSSTHQKGHILDLVITREHSNLLKRPPVVFISGVSDVKSSSSLDHFAVLCYLNVNRPKTIHKSVKFRAFRNIPVPDYRNDVKLLMCNRRKPQKNIDDLINNYNSTLQKLTDKYAPLQCKTISLRPHAPWYTSALRQEKRVRRRGERVAARTMLEVDRQIVQDMYRRRNEQLVEAKTSYFTKKVEESKDNPKALFRLTRNMMGNSGETILPLHTCKRNMANDFSAFFYNKILNIRSELGLPGLYKCGSMTTSFSGTPLTTFMDATEVEIRNIIKLSPAKSCELDPLPTWLLKECIAELVPTITDIVNMSLRDFLMPKSLKTALIRPLLKKTGLDSDILKNYRPVSNLTFISKVIEKVVSGRLNEHLIKNSMFDPLQSAYRDKHSTETALIKVQNDILSALDAGSSAILLMLDLSAAFDTIDHDILLSRLCNVYGITGDALDWFRSYLTGRIQRVVIEDAVSGDQELGFGVSQGSVLGPKIYCMYTKPVSDIIQRHGLSYHSYADDTQLYMTMDHSNNNWRDGLARIQLCVSEIREWMNQNMLKLNDDKTELIVFTSKYKQDLYNDLSITIGDTVVDCSSQVKNLGVIFDRVLSLRQHVSYTSKTCRFHLRNISRIRKYIPQDTSVVLVKSLVMSRLDYSNGLFYGLPKCTVSGLQGVQNSAARIVTQERLRDHDSMSRALIGLHWLPVDKRIEYKLLLYTYKALHDLAPGYLCELVVPYVPRRVLRSAELNLLTVPPGKPGKYGSRSFARASANLWNSLRGERAAWLKNSPTLESFKRNLKTFLFWERFPS